MKFTTKCLHNDVAKLYQLLMNKSLGELYLWKFVTVKTNLITQKVSTKAVIYLSNINDIFILANEI